MISGESTHMDPPLQSLVEAAAVLRRAEANRRQTGAEGQQGRPVKQERAIVVGRRGKGGGAGKRWQRWRGHTMAAA